MDDALAGVTLFDMHCHLDFFADSALAAHELEGLGVCALSATVTPEGFATAARELSDARNVAVGAGLHPWWVADGSCSEREVGQMVGLAARERVVAEVGLDFARGRDAAATTQVAALDRILGTCEAGGHVLSLHAVRSTSAVLDLLERHGTAANNEVILHWFSGSGSELTRATHLGCRFSVGSRMLVTKRGRAYARQIPASQLLLETDLPGDAAEGADLPPRMLREGLEQALLCLAELRGTDAHELAATIGHTSERLLFDGETDGR